MKILEIFCKAIGKCNITKKCRSCFLVLSQICIGDQLKQVCGMVWYIRVYGIEWYHRVWQCRVAIVGSHPSCPQGGGHPHHPPLRLDIPSVEPPTGFYYIHFHFNVVYK